jgi:formate dehydrogenase
MKIVAVRYSGGKIAKRTPTLLGSAENALGLREFLVGKGHDFVILTDKEAELDKHLPSTDVIITTPF